MSAPSVDFDREYRFRDGVTRLDAAELNARFLSLHARLRALEAISFTFEALAIEIGNLGIQRINALILPLIEQAQAELATIVEASEAALELLAQIQQAGLPAVNITLAPIPGLSAETVQDGLAELAVQMAQRPTRGESVALAIALG